MSSTLGIHQQLASMVWDMPEAEARSLLMYSAARVAACMREVFEEVARMPLSTKERALRLMAEEGVSQTSTNNLQASSIDHFVIGTRICCGRRLYSPPVLDPTPGMVLGAGSGVG